MSLIWAAAVLTEGWSKWWRYNWTMIRLVLCVCHKSPLCCNHLYHPQGRMESISMVCWDTLSDIKYNWAQNISHLSLQLKLNRVINSTIALMKIRLTVHYNNNDNINYSPGCKCAICCKFYVVKWWSIKDSPAKHNERNTWHRTGTKDCPQNILQTRLKAPWLQWCAPLPFCFLGEKSLPETKEIAVRSLPLPQHSTVWMTLDEGN